MRICCVSGVYGEVWIPSQDGKDVEENMEEALVCSEGRGASLLQITSQFKWLLMAFFFFLSYFIILFCFYCLFISFINFEFYFICKFSLKHFLTTF